MAKITYDKDIGPYGNLTQYIEFFGLTLKDGATGSKAAVTDIGGATITYFGTGFTFSEGEANDDVWSALGATTIASDAAGNARQQDASAAALPTDTLFSQQWYLRNTTAGQYDLDVAGVWSEFTGKGVRIMVMSSGFDYHHSDLAPNYDKTLDRDYGSGDNDAAPVLADDNGGTAQMGIIAAARNGTGVVGVAYGATLIGARMDYEASADVWSTSFASALGDAVAKHVGVVDISVYEWASFGEFYSPANFALQKAAIATAVDDGRNGLGIALVKPAGSGRGDGLHVNHSDADNNSAEIIVAGVNRDGFVSSYSRPGAPILVSAFGSPESGQIVTADRVGAAGYDNGNFTSTYSGTQAASAMVSGVVALMEQANDQLGWRDIQSILASTARHVGSVIDGSTTAGSELTPWHWNTAKHWNGGGMHFSDDYGYGLVDARAAVRLAESWDQQSTSANQQVASLDLLDVPVNLPDNDSMGKYYGATMAGDVVIERVTVTVTMSSTFPADLKLILTGPDYQQQTLIAGQGNGTDFTGTFTMHSQAYRGENSADYWSVRVADTSAGDIINISDIRIDAYGAAQSADDTFIFTNEFSDYTHATVILDNDGGIDTVNASAVSSASTIDLLIGTGKIDGVSVVFTNIENAYGGDGKDMLTGDHYANVLAGGRGKDTLMGNLGIDTFLYRTVADSLAGTARDVIVDFGNGGDETIDLSDIDTRANAAGDQAFRWIGAQNFHGKPTELRFEIINKAGAANDMTIVSGDINGDKHADFEIQLTDIQHLTVGDFAL